VKCDNDDNVYVVNVQLTIESQIGINTPVSVPILRWSCSPVSRVLLFSVTSFCY
jgi:hypothetical protein